MTDVSDPAQAWGEASRNYGEHVAPRMMEVFAEEICDRLRASKDDDALEVAAGTGALTATLARRVQSVLATDFSSGMLKVLRERMGARKLDNIEFAQMDGMALDLEDGRFDVAASSFGIMLFPDRARGFAELRRVLRPGGRVAATGWTGPDRFEAFGLFLAAVEAAFPELPPPAEPPPVFSLADADVFAQELKQAGFVDVHVDNVARVTVVDGFEVLWTMMTSGAPPVKVLFDRVGDQGVERIRDELHALVQRRYGTGPFEVTNVATLGWGVAP